jgi:thiol-disulfide isomerase/thioredoxin
MKTKILVVLMMALVSVGTAQQLKPLTVGDKVPDVIFNTMLNYKTPSGKLSEFKGKAIIIDMWFRECGSCVDAMPHLDSVQKAYNDDLQVLLVTWQSKTQIEEFWKKRLPVQGLKFTQVVEDTMLKQLFPAIGYPHQIWIDKNGVVKSINDGTKTTKENINKLIKDEPINLTIKKEELDPAIHNASSPMIGISYQENKNKTIHYSYLSSYRPEFLGPSGLEMPDNGQVRVKFLNQHYAFLYHVAYSSELGAPYDRKNRIVRKDNNPLKHTPDLERFSNFFCYDLIYRDTTNTSFGKYMIEDLDRYLGFKSHVEIEKIKTLIIRPNGKGTQYQVKLNSNEPSFTEHGKFGNGKPLILNNSLIEFLNRSAMEQSAMPTVFEFPGEKRLNLKIIWDLENLPAMNKQLEKYDLKAAIEDRETKVIVLEVPL